MSLRRTIIELDTNGLNVTEFCREHGVSGFYFYDLRRRHRLLGDVVLEPLSRAPHTVANRTPAAVEDLIVETRKRLEDFGDAGPATIHTEICRLGLCPVPSESTIYRVLKRRGFIVAEPRKRPKRSGHRFVAERANQLWQIDDTTWFLADGTEVKIINIIDDCSRLNAAAVAVASCTKHAVLDALLTAGERWGLPEKILSDNGASICAAIDELTSLGIASTHSRPYHPQTCGKVERFHQTLKKFLARQPPATTIAELQAQLETFRAYYNHRRPHRGINRRTPISVWETTPKSGPATTPLTTRTEIHHAIVRANGTVDAGRRYTISLGNKHANQPATIVITGLSCHVFINARLARHLNLNPTRHKQPLYNRTGRPPVTVSDVSRHP